MFCKKCGSIVRGRECGCGETQIPQVMTEKQVKTPEIQVMESKDHLATLDHVCPKCGYGKARLYTKGTLVSDEDEHMAFVCGKCGHHDSAGGLKIT